MNVSTKSFLGTTLALLVLSGCMSTSEEQTPSQVAEVQAPEPTIEEVCDTQRNCRTSTQVLLATPSGEVSFDYDQYWPVVYDNEITILPGERVLVEIEFDEFQQVQHMRHVTERTNPERTFEFYFTQIRGNYGMLMSLRNPLTRPVLFDVEIKSVDGQTYRVSTCPIRGRMSFHERWPEPAAELVLKRPRIVNEPSNGVLVCS
ncbi:MAG: hypothetical protein LAT77_02915 [Aliidiomarina sp.]|uniref:hypothetical protein n=1 Tax=Aliidiomarina sp. TaxID=1872439 RepID=UPI0025C5FD6F|nr:hypothetical protein [Aliidiomarina sp.]MCH8500845.1 hypothetical protein [Aliidiomarina sp.]